MLSYPLRWVPTTALVLLYFAQTTHTTAISLLDLLPDCASECLENFISTEYPRNVCSEGCDLNYLCTENTTSGYTLGEAALRCSLSLCSTEVALSFNTYSICDSVPGALPQTHPTIIATITSPGNPTSTTGTNTIITAQPETTNTSSTTDPTSTETEPTSTTITTFQSPTSTADGTQDPSTETGEPTSTTSTDSAPGTTSNEPSSEPSHGSKLNSGAVIGVSVASGIAGFFIIGVIIFFCCRKIRRKVQDRQSFEIGGHMSEPPDFSFPPKRPPLGPRPSPGTLNTDSENARLVPPVDAEHQSPVQYPAVIVTEPEEDYYYGNMPAGNADREDFQPSSNFEYDSASVASSRTVSDLLPDKPTYELYPRPLRWSHHKKSRPSSGATIFEEENYSRSRNLPSPSLPQSSFPPRGESGQNRLPMPGLPANPRAMMYGFGRPGQTMAMNGLAHGKKLVHWNAGEKSQPSRQAAIHGTFPYQSSHMDHDDNLDNYWQSSDAGFVGAKVIEPHGVARGAGSNRNSVGDYPGYDFEFGFGDNFNSESRRASRHSGSFRPLTPVREIRTPMGEAQNPFSGGSNNGSKQTMYPPRSPPGLPNSQQEIVSRPRIVRQDDIKRVQIRRGKTSPKEVTVPYCPDDYWLEQSKEASSAYNAPRYSGGYQYGPKDFLGMPKKKPSPLERNLTPSRRGADLILQVE
ncbi:hypothetical protein BDW62DRAFT_98008 [Aspergillus aurantiobrunneus]